jgi:hypothetical protein
MSDLAGRWHQFYADHLERTVKVIFEHVERVIVGTLIVSAGTHVATDEPAIQLFGYLRHGLIGRGVELFGVVLLALNFFDGLFRLYRLKLPVLVQFVLAFCYVALSVRLIQLILAFRGE